MAENPPYMLSPPTLARALEKVRSAATPERFTHDFLANTLGMKGGTPRPLIPFLKRIGFLASDGSPTELYKRFRNPAEAGAAAAEGLRIGYHQLFEMNEKAHTLTDNELKGLVVQATGLEKDSRTVQAIIGSFKTLKALASFKEEVKKPPEEKSTLPVSYEHPPRELELGMNISYTFNLNLPATTDISVFNAIFKSLKENLLK